MDESKNGERGKDERKVRVEDSAELEGAAQLEDRGKLEDEAKLTDEAKLKDKAELKDKVRQLTPAAREELGHLLLESVLERMSEEEGAEGEDEQTTIGRFEVIVEEEPDPESA